MKSFAFAITALLSGTSLLVEAKPPTPECSIEDLAGAKFELEYAFYRSSDPGSYSFPGAAALSFTKPEGGEGVMEVTYCFNVPGGRNSNRMVAAQTGFSKGGVVPIKIAKYEPEEKLMKIYNEYTLTGEYDCNSEELIVGLLSYFEGNSFSLVTPAERNDNLELDDNACLL